MNRRDLFRYLAGLVAGLLGCKAMAAPVKKESPPPRRSLHRHAEASVENEVNWQPISCQVVITSYLDGKGRPVRLVTGNVYYARSDCILAYRWVEKLRSPARMPGSAGSYKSGMTGRLGLLEFEFHDICG